MNTISAIIIDDERPGRKLINEYLRRRDDVQVVAECRDAHQAYAAINKLKPDLIFLDIRMPEIDGFELLAMLDDIPHVIFSTAFDQYAIKAFEVNAVDYLLKPYDEERFNIALDRVIQQIEAKIDTTNLIKKIVATAKPQQPYLERLLIKESGRILILNSSEIIFAEAMGDYVQLNTNNESYLIQQSLTTLESRLNPNRFIRVHRSYIVNIDSVREIVSMSPNQNRIVLKNGQQIALSRSGIQKIKRFSI